MTEYTKTMKIRRDIKAMYGKIRNPDRARACKGDEHSRASKILAITEAFLEESGRVLDRAHQVLSLVENDNKRLSEELEVSKRMARKAEAERDSFELMWKGELGIRDTVEFEELAEQWIEIENIMFSGRETSKEEWLGAMWAFAKLMAYADPEVLARFEDAARRPAGLDVIEVEGGASQALPDDTQEY